MLSKNQAKHLRSLQRKKTRQEQRLFVVEGAKIVAETLQDTNWQVQELYASAEFLHTHSELINLQPSQITPCSAAELTSVSSLVSNKDALAVVSQPQEQLACQQLAANTWALLAEDLNDPGNLGSLLRIADWFGIQQLVCSPTSVEVYNPKVLAASKGSFLRVAVSYQDLTAYIAAQAPKTPVVGAYLNGTSIHQLNPVPTGGLLVLGNESRGISSSLSRYITQKVTIPGYGGAESLNVAVAAAIICDNLLRPA